MHEIEAGNAEGCPLRENNWDEHDEITEKDIDGLVPGRIFANFFDKSFIGTYASNKTKLYKSTTTHPCSWPGTN